MNGRSSHLNLTMSVRLHPDRFRQLMACILEPFNRWDADNPGVARFVPPLKCRHLLPGLDNPEAPYLKPHIQDISAIGKLLPASV